ncbi:proteasome subunit beta type-1 [Citrus sinensis]|nr:proteasome subunit beta type-1 [Citrus sinensis]
MKKRRRKKEEPIREEEREPPKVSPFHKGKEKILEEEELESKWEGNVDAAIEQVISTVARTEIARISLRDLIASITEPTTAKPAPATAQQTLTESYVTAPRTCVAIAGADYCVTAADTRMSTGYSILSRDYSKIIKLADKCVMASSGFQADVKALQKLLAARHLIYQHQHNKQMSCPAMGQLLSNTLYYKRFFPYYSFNVLGGLDNEGKGCVYTYDAVGSYERVGYSSQGSGSTLIMPFLDNQLKSPSPLLLPAQDAVTPLSEAEAVDLVKTCFASATERDIYTASFFLFPPSLPLCDGIFVGVRLQLW